MEKPLSDFDIQDHSQGSSIDFKRVLERAIRFWYLVVLSLVVSLFLAFYNTRYSQRVYSVDASIMIRETQETGGAELLYKNALIDPYRNYLNEPYIIKSYPLIEKVVQELSFNIRFYREGYFLTSEAYNYIPVEAKWCEPERVRAGKFLFKIVDSEKYSLKEFDKPEAKELEFLFNDSVRFDGYALCIRKKDKRDIKPFIGENFLLVIDGLTPIATSYINKLQVNWAEEGAGIILLGIVGSLPEKEIDFLNKLIESYQALDLAKKNETAERTISFIRDQLISIKDSLRMVEFQLERFGNSSRVKDMSAEAQRLLTRMESYEAQKSDLLIRHHYFTYLNDYFKSTVEIGDQIIVPSSVGVNDPVLNNLLNRLIDIQIQLKLHTGSGQRDNPLLNSKISQMSEIKEDVKAALDELRNADKIKMDFLQKQIAEADNQLQRLPVSERQLISVQRNYSLLENLYVFLMQKLSEAGISKAANTSDIIAINYPMRGSIISPKPLYNYSIGLAVGLLLPFFIFVIFELLNNKIQSKEDIEKMTDIPFIGGLGHNSKPSSLAVYSEPRSGLAESFRALRSNLNFFTGNKAKKVFMVTSSISGEGKTFTTINLATVFALSGKKTLIVGADMRKPRIYEDFRRNNEKGLSTFLSGLDKFEEVVQNTEVENLFLISGGPAPPNPSELLLTNKFEEFIKIALNTYDFVLIDTPPLALVTDAFVISKYVDHTVFVVRQNYSPKEFIRSIDEFHKSSKISKISILLNDIYKTGLGYGYGYHYGYGYGYAYGGYYGRRASNGYYEE